MEINATRTGVTMTFKYTDGSTGSRTLSDLLPTAVASSDNALGLLQRYEKIVDGSPTKATFVAYEPIDLD